MIKKLGRAAGIAATAVALGAACSTVLGGTAFAGGHGEHHNDGGEGGHGGKAAANCVVPVGVSAGVVGQGGPVDQCNSYGGDGGDGGDGANY